jgi:hypothetical protein
MIVFYEVMMHATRLPKIKNAQTATEHDKKKFSTARIKNAKKIVQNKKKNLLSMAPVTVAAMTSPKR